MRTILRTFVLVFVFSVLLQAAETFGNVEYLYKPDGKDKGQEIGGVLYFDAPTKKVIFQSKKITLDVSAHSMTSALYERTSRPRYVSGLLLAWPLLFTKGKKHFLTLQYQGASGDGRYALFHLDKGNSREILAAAEATTGKKVERFEER